MNFNFKNEKEVLEFLKENKIVKFVRIIFPDVLGREMSFTIPSEEMKSAFEKDLMEVQLKDLPELKNQI